jgi:cytochrome c oxidase subunit 2
MRGVIVVETQEQYDAYMAKQQSYYALNNAPAAPAAAAPAGGAEQSQNPGGKTAEKPVMMKN